MNNNEKSVAITKMAVDIMNNYDIKCHEKLTMLCYHEQSLYNCVIHE